MVELRHSARVPKATGSKALLKGLQSGDLKLISERFKVSYVRVRGIIVGKHAGPIEVVECAERLVALYDSLEFDKKRTEILESYGSTNKK